MVFYYLLLQESRKDKDHEDIKLVNKRLKTSPWTGQHEESLTGIAVVGQQDASLRVRIIPPHSLRLRDSVRRDIR